MKGHSVSDTDDVTDLLTDFLNHPPINGLMKIWSLGI